MGSESFKISESFRTSESTKVSKSPKKPELLEKSIKENTIDSTGNIELEEIISKWPELLKAAKQHNHHLVAILTSSKPIALEHSELTLEVPFVYHKKRISDKDTQKILKQISKSVFGRNFTFKSVINKELASKGSKENFSNEKIVEEIFNDEAEMEE